MTGLLFHGGNLHLRGILQQGGLAVGAAFLRLAEADGALIEILLQHLGDAIGQGAHAVGSEPKRTPAADAAQLALDVCQALGGLDGRGEAQHIRDEAPDGFRDGSGIGAGFGCINKDLEGLSGAVLVDGDEGFAQWGFDGVSLT